MAHARYVKFNINAVQTATTIKTHTHTEQLIKKSKCSSLSVDLNMLLQLNVSVIFFFASVNPLKRCVDCVDNQHIGNAKTGFNRESLAFRLRLLDHMPCTRSLHRWHLQDALKLLKHKTLDGSMDLIQSTL